MRRVALLAVALTLGPILAACGGGVAVSAPGGLGDDDGATGGQARPSAAPMQAFNGPPSARALAVPLRIKAPTAPGPRLADPLKEEPRAGIVVDLDSGDVLWSHAPTRDLPIASLTKMMTALVVVGNAKATERVRITNAAAAAPGSRVGLLPRGKDVQLESLLYGLLLPSGNDAAVALAHHVGGTVERFVAMMNAQARALGLTCTRFDSPSGFEEVKLQRQARNRSCAHDLAVLARAVLDQPRLARIVRTRDVVRPFPIKGGKLYLHNNNPLLVRRYPGTIGLKTGYTDAAGHSLVAAARRGSHRLGVVLLHSPDTGRQASALLNRGFRALGAG